MRIRWVSLRANILLAAVPFCWATNFVLAPAVSQTPQLKQRSSSDVLVLKKTVRRVLGDVVVRDLNGNAVHGLSARDCALSEDGKPQRVLSLDVHDLESPSISIPPNAPPLPPNTFVNIPTIPERGPLYVLLLDLVNTELEDQMTSRKQLLSFVDGKPAGSRLAIFVNSDRLYLLQGFTSDPNSFT